jgi:DNA-directed RNA polymerase specialized sigma24 family protein
MDPGLVERAQGGDEEAFGLLAVPLGDRLFAVATRILRDDDLAADATQQALVSIWRDLPQLRDLARFDAWAYRLLVRACYAERRQERRWSPSLRVLPTAHDGGAADDVRYSSTATKWNGRRGGCRSTIASSSSCATTSTYRTTTSPSYSASRSGPFARDCAMH